MKCFIGTLLYFPRKSKTEQDNITTLCVVKWVRDGTRMTRRISFSSANFSYVAASAATVSAAATAAAALFPDQISTLDNTEPTHRATVCGEHECMYKKGRGESIALLQAF